MKENCDKQGMKEKEQQKLDEITQAERDSQRKAIIINGGVVEKVAEE